MQINRLAPLLILFCAISTFAQEGKCTMRLADLPESSDLFRFRMGMTTAQVKTRVPQVVFKRPNEFGVSKTSISPDFDPRIDKLSFIGIRTVSLDFLDDRLTSLWFGYDGSFKWQTVPDLVTGISQALHLPDAWRPWKIRGQQLQCADFQMTVSMLGEGPSFHIIDQSAEQTIAARRVAKEEQDSATEDMPTAEIPADKRDKVYYSLGCLPAHAIKAEDRVIFKSKKEAEESGYKLAKTCQ
jgi:hypothetical protein